MAIWPFPSSPSIVLGTYAGGFPGLPGKVALTAKEIATHKHVIGLTGQGKSKFLASYFLQLMNQGVGCALIDPHADLGTDILGTLIDTGFFKDSRAYQRLLYVDFANSERFLPFNVLAQPYEPHFLARTIVEVCKRTWSALGDGAAPQFENILLSSVVVLAENHVPLTELPRLLTDKPYRDGLLRSVSDPLVRDFFLTRFDQWGKGSSLMVESTLRRAFLLTFSPALRYALGQRRNVLDFRQLMDRGVCIIFNLGGLDEETQRFLGCLLTVGFEVAALSRADIPENERRQYHLICDEFSMFSATSEEALARVLSLTRKYGLYLTLAHQTWSQLSQRLQGALQNCVRIAFRLGHDDAKWAATRIAKPDPYAIKHLVDDKTQIDRTHPVYLSLAEQTQAWAQILETLEPRHAVASLANKTVEIKTLAMPPAKCGRQQLLAVIERYAQMLLTPLSDVAASDESRSGASMGQKRGAEESRAPEQNAVRSRQTSTLISEVEYLDSEDTT
jgi:hypothetical protein